MADNSPGAPVRKRRLIAPLVIAVIVAGLLLAAALGLFGRKPTPEPAPAEVAPAPQTVTPLTPLAPPVLSRVDLIEGARAAAAAHAAGEPPADGVDPLVRRTFRIR